MISSALTAKDLLKDPEAAIRNKRGTPLTEADIKAIEGAVLGSDGPGFDRETFSKECLFQASLLARMSTGTLVELGKKYYEKKPSPEDAQAALVYVQQGTRLLSQQSRGHAKIAQIAGAFAIAGYPEIAVEMVKCTGIEEYLIWKDESELAGEQLPAKPK